MYGITFKGLFYLSFIYTTAFLLMFFKSILFVLILICVNARHLKNENIIKLLDTVNKTNVVEQLFNLTKLNYQNSITSKLNILMYEIEI
jgi:hypothetical protein